MTSDQQPVDPYNPLGLPQYTIRARFNGTPEPTYNGGFSGTISHVSGDIYDIQTSNWVRLFGAYFGDLGEFQQWHNIPVENLDTNSSGQQINRKPVEVLGANCSGVTSLKETFFNCSSLTSIPPMDTSSVTNMRLTFSDCSSLTSIPLMDTSNVTEMWGMFMDCRSLTSVPSFDTHNVTVMNHMFAGCIALTTAPSLSTESVTNFGYMFEECASLTSVPQYDMASAEYTSYMFSWCPNVSSGAIELYTSVSQQASPPANHYAMFRDCGLHTTNGLAELRQISHEWGGRYGDIRCKKYYYSNSRLDLETYTPRVEAGFLCGAIWIPSNNVSYGSGQLYSIWTPAIAGTMRIYPPTKFYVWRGTATQSHDNHVFLGAFAIPKANLYRQNVYGSYYGWRSSSEPQFLFNIADLGNIAPDSGYVNVTLTVDANRTLYINPSYPSLPADWAILICLYIYTNNTYYFGTVSRPDYGYLPYESNNDLFVQVSNLNPST